MNHLPEKPTLPLRRLAIVARGVVQGVGFRPFVYQTACAQGLTGWVCNEADAVRIEVEGNQPALEAFVAALRHAHPPQACIDAVEVREVTPESGAPDTARGTTTFQIRASTGTTTPQPSIPADLATCRQCLAEIHDPAQRRYRYPFTNCTNCGPRWSIIEQLPYDRPRTAMSAFAMCAACRAEYDDPSDRRFHAQPIACPRCGPMLQLLDPHGQETARGEAALAAAIRAILDGRIVALKGLGGFQLVVDATNTQAIVRLRQRKHRPDRPLALMSPSLDAVRQYCHVSDEEAGMMDSHRAPIVLLRKLPADSRCCPPWLPLAAGVAPENPYLGMMLPYTPLHHLLLAALERPVVCTSGNLSEEPMAITTDDALDRLGPIADVLLTHNRPIVRPVDDSIVRFVAGRMQVLRRARGFAPLPIALNDVLGADADTSAEADRSPAVLAVGGHLKNTVALALSGIRRDASRNDAGRRPSAQVVLSSHGGDLESTAGVEVFHRAADDLVRFFQTTPGAVACDLHPDYASTQRAERLAARWNVPLVRIQHHHAHVAACVAEHGLQGPVLGFSWDGAGYGLDETVWGGEMLWCEGTRFRRIAHLRTFVLPGGDQAAREPRRSALGLLFEIFASRAAEHAVRWFKASEIDTLLAALVRRVNAPRTSSMGRLFDAVAAICGLTPVSSFEGQAAMALEFAADPCEPSAYTIPLHPREALIADWELMLQAILSDRAAEVPLACISARFHNALAEMAVAVAMTVAKPDTPIILTGGCFQNALLTTGVEDRLSAAGFRVYTHSRVPSGDGGIALGQALLALRHLLTPKE